MQGFVNPPRVRGKGQKGKGQGKAFLTLNKPLTLVQGQGFSRGFSGVLQLRTNKDNNFGDYNMGTLHNP